MLILLFVLLVAVVIWELNLEKKNKNTEISEVIGVTDRYNILPLQSIIYNR